MHVPRWARFLEGSKLLLPLPGSLVFSACDFSSRPQGMGQLECTCQEQETELPLAQKKELVINGQECLTLPKAGSLACPWEVLEPESVRTR